MRFSEAKDLDKGRIRVSLLGKSQKFSLKDFLTFKHNLKNSRTSLVIQWLILHTSIAEGAGSILDQGSSACLIVPPKTKKKKKNSSS